MTASPSVALRRAGDWPVHHPRATTFILVILTALAIAAAVRIPIDRLMIPVTTRLLVRAELPGVDALSVETVVTKRLEKALAALPGLSDMESRSRDGEAVIHMQLRAGVDRDRALTDARTRLAQAISNLPPGMKAPRLSVDHASDSPAAVYAIAATTLADDLVRWVKNVLVDPLRESSEVASVTTTGAARREILIQPDPRRLAGLGLAFDDLIEATRRRDIAPRPKSARRAVTSGSVESIAARAVRLPSGESIALAEVANVSIADESIPLPVTYNGAPALRLEIYPRTPASATRIAERTQAHFAWLRANDLVPRAATIHVLHDEARATAQWLQVILQRAGICFTAILVVIATFFRLRTVSSSVIGFSVWLSATMALLAQGGHALNNATAVGAMLAAAPLAILLVSRFEAVDLWRVVIVGVIAWVAALVLGANAQASIAFAVGLLVAVMVRWLLSPWLVHRADASTEFAAPDSAHGTGRRRTSFASVVAILSLVVAIASGYALPDNSANGGSFTFRLRGEDPQQLTAIVNPLLVSLRVIPGVERVASTAELQERWRMQLDPERMEVVGIGLAEIGRAFTIARDGLPVGEIVNADKQLVLRLQLAPGSAGESFEQLLLRGESVNRPAIYLRHVGVAEKTTAARELIRFNGKPAIEITATWRNADARAALQDFCNRVDVPPAYSTNCSLRNSPT